jgi:hypothetical protein
MTATWAVKIDVKSAPTRWVSVTGTRTDATTTPPDVRAYTIDNLNVPSTGLGGFLDGLAAKLRQLYISDVAANTANAAIIASGESALAIKLNALEA